MTYEYLEDNDYPEERIKKHIDDSEERIKKHIAYSEARTEEGIITLHIIQIGLIFFVILLNPEGIWENIKFVLSWGLILGLILGIPYLLFLFLRKILKELLFIPSRLKRINRRFLLWRVRVYRAFQWEKPK